VYVAGLCMLLMFADSLVQFGSSQYGYGAEHMCVAVFSHTGCRPKYIILFF
jgi:hypothetical protein